jgi:hypothetical protein
MVWTSTWTAPDDVAKRQAFLNSCDVLTQFGPVRGYDLVRVVSVGPNLQRVYGVVRYENQPIYLLLVAYRASTVWKVTSINWHTNSENVFPPEILAPENRRP